MNDNLITAAVFAAFIALIISLINAYRVTKIKKKCEVDILNQKEDMKITWDKIKYNLNGDIKGIKRDISKINRPQSHKPTPSPKRQEEPLTNKKKEENSPKQTTPNPRSQNSRPKNYKPRRKPTQKPQANDSKTESDSK